MGIWEQRRFMSAAGNEGSDSVEGSGLGVPAADSPNWYDSFSDESLKANPSVTKYKTAEDAAKGIASLVGMVGAEKIVKPDYDNPEDVQRFHDEVGIRPEGAGDYKLPEGVTVPEVGWDDGFAMRMIDAMHKAGASQEMFEAVMVPYLGEATAATEMLAAREMQGYEATQTALSTEYGLEKDAALDVGNRAVTAIFGDAAGEISELHLADGTRLSDHMPYIRAMVAYGKQLHEESPPEGRPAGQGFGMTPKQAQKELEKLKGDPEFNRSFGDRKDPGHKAAAERWQQLNSYARPPTETP